MSYGYHEKLLARYVKRLEETLKRWNPFTGDAPITVPREALPPAEKSPYASAGSAFDARKFWGRALQEGAPTEGDAYLWDETAGAFVLGPAAGGEPEAGTGFLAHGGADQDLEDDPIKFLATTQNWDLGGLYNAAAATWTPPVGPVVFLFHIRTHTSSVQPVIGVYKNGGPAWLKYGGRYSYLGDGWTEGVWMDFAGGADVYELRVGLHPDDAGETANIVAGESFWSGVAIQAGGGSGGGSSAPLTGDVTTAGSVSTLQALHGIPFTTATPVDGDFLVYSASANKLVWRAGEITTPDFAVVHDGDLVYSGGELVISTP